MEIKVTGKIVSRGEIRTGESQNGKWASIDYVLEEANGGAYPGKVVFSVNGEERVRAVWNVLQIGTMAIVSIDVNAREYNGRWFNNLRAYKVEVNGQEAIQNIKPQQHVQSAPQPMMAQPMAQPQPQPNVFTQQEQLPF